jgi:hypothetical protein
MGTTLEEPPIEWEPASRAVVSDDGQTTRLTGAVAAVTLSPVALAGKLIEAAGSRLSR